MGDSEAQLEAQEGLVMPGNFLRRVPGASPEDGERREGEQPGGDPGAGYPGL